jgi:putative endonuclease
MVGDRAIRYRCNMTGYVYMTASQKRGTIYIGVTNDLGRRMPEHKSGQGSRFTSQYGVQRLVWYEEYFDITDAIQREKSLKRWPRQWKIELIGQSGLVRALSRNGMVRPPGASS